MNAENVFDPVNLGNPGEFTIAELAREVVELCDSASGIKFETLPLDDPRQRKPDIARAKELLQWEPTIQLRDGLKLTIADFAARVKSGSVVAAI